MLRRLNHVALIVDDLEKADAFYSGLLRLPHVERPPEVQASGPGIWYQLGDVKLHLYTAPEPPHKSARHFSIEVDDLDDLIRKARDAGYEVEDVFRFGEFKRRKYIRDPFGNRVELMSRE